MSKSKVKMSLSANLLVMSVSIPFTSMAKPFTPGEDSLPPFSQEVFKDFTILKDTNDPDLVYYVPKMGMVRVTSPNSKDPKPSFATGSWIPSYGFWAGEELSRFGGTFSSFRIGRLNRLEKEARNLGLRAEPAPVTDAKVSFLVDGRVAEDGRIDVKCEWEEITIKKSSGETRTTRIPECSTRKNPNDDYDISTNVIQRMGRTNFRGSNVIANLGF